MNVNNEYTLLPTHKVNSDFYVSNTIINIIKLRLIPKGYLKYNIYEDESCLISRYLGILKCTYLVYHKLQLFGVE